MGQTMPIQANKQRYDKRGADKMKAAVKKLNVG